MNETKIINNLEANFIINETAVLPTFGFVDIEINLPYSFPIKLKDPTIKSLQEWREAIFWKYVSNNTGPSLNPPSLLSDWSLLEEYRDSSWAYGTDVNDQLSSYYPKDWHKSCTYLFEKNEIESALVARQYKWMSVMESLYYQENSLHFMPFLWYIWLDSLDIAWYSNFNLGAYVLRLLSPLAKLLQSYAWIEIQMAITQLLSCSTYDEIIQGLAILWLTFLRSAPYTEEGAMSALPFFKYKVGWGCTEGNSSWRPAIYTMSFIPIKMLRNEVKALLQKGKLKKDTQLYDIIKAIGAEKPSTSFIASYLYDMINPSTIIRKGGTTYSNRNSTGVAQLKYIFLPAWDNSLLPKEPYDEEYKMYELPTRGYFVKLIYPTVTEEEPIKDMIVTTKIVNLETGKTIADNPKDFWQSWLKYTKDVKSTL